MAVNSFAAAVANVLPQLNQMIPNLMSNLNANNNMQQNPLTTLLGMQSNTSLPVKDDKHMRSVFVGNIPYETTDDDIKNIFSQVGQVLSFRMVFDRETGKPKGYGFCEFKDVETAQCAIRNLNGIELHGRTLRVDSAASEKGREELKIDAKVEILPNCGTNISADDAPQFITNLISSLPPEHLYEILLQMKTCIRDHPDESRQMLYQNPQLSYALLQALVVMKCIDSNEAQTMLYVTRPDNPPQVLMPLSFGLPMQSNVPVVIPQNQNTFSSQDTQPQWNPLNSQEPMLNDYHNNFQGGFVPPQTHQLPQSRFNPYHDNNPHNQPPLHGRKYDYPPPDHRGPPSDHRGPPSHSNWSQDYHEDRPIPYDYHYNNSDYDERGRHFSQSDPRKSRGHPPPPMSRHDDYPRSAKNRSDPRSHAYDNPRDRDRSRENSRSHNSSVPTNDRSNHNDPRTRGYNPPPLPHTQSQNATSAGSIPVSEDEKSKIINQVMSLTDQQLASLSEEEQRNIMILREQINRGIIP